MCPCVLDSFWWVIINMNSILGWVMWSNWGVSVFVQYVYCLVVHSYRCGVRRWWLMAKMKFTRVMCRWMDGPGVMNDMRCDLIGDYYYRSRGSELWCMANTWVQSFHKYHVYASFGMHEFYRNYIEISHEFVHFQENLPRRSWGFSTASQEAPATSQVTTPMRYRTSLGDSRASCHVSRKGYSQW